MDRHIHIVTERGEALQPKHVISLLLACWREQGLHVTVGPVRRLEADLGIMHVDRTWVPAAVVPENPAGRPLLNARVLDISKRRVSPNLVTRGAAYAGPVIVKTDANSFGKKDFNGPPRRRLWTLRRRLAEKGASNLARMLPPRDYPVYDDIATVPGWMWKRDDLVVEKFLPEREGDEYSLRVWMFIGGRDYGLRLFSRHPVVKTGNITRYDRIHEVPAQIRTAREDLEIDYGKIDYVIVDGEPVLLDVNKTPTAATQQSFTKNLLHLAGSISGLLGQRHGDAN